MADSKKYVLLGNTIRSRADGDVYYISAARLVELYGLRRSECIMVEYRELEQKYRTIPEGLQWLGPRYDGNYQIDKEAL